MGSSVGGFWGLVVTRRARFFQLNLCENEVKHQGLCSTNVCFKKSYILRSKSGKYLLISTLKLRHFEGSFVWKFYCTRWKINGPFHLVPLCHIQVLVLLKQIMSSLTWVCIHASHSIFSLCSNLFLLLTTKIRFSPLSFLFLLCFSSSNFSTIDQRLSSMFSSLAIDLPKIHSHKIYAINFKSKHNS